MKKFSIDIKTARQLEDLRQANDWSWKEMYAYYFGTGNATEVSDKDADALRKQVERKKNKVQHIENADKVLEPSTIATDKTISYELSGDEIASASGTVYLDGDADLVTDSKRLVEALFTEFNLDEEQYEITKYTPSFINGKFKVLARFEKRKNHVYNEASVVARYTDILANIGAVHATPVHVIDQDNILVINLADVHFNKMPYFGYSSTYLEEFEAMVYASIDAIMEDASKFPINRAVITIGHDFFQIDNPQGTTKKGTPVSHVLPYEDMFDIGVRILATCVYKVQRKYVTDCHYVLANHDSTAGWHASRELKVMFREVPHVNFVVDKNPFHYVEWGSTLIELTHANLKGGRSHTNMSVVAREAWGRTKYHYSIGGHLHGEYATKESGGVVAFGSRALSDTDEWHYLNGYLANIRGIQAYVFNKTKGHRLTVNENL